MTAILDAAYPPPRFLSGQPWAGYLHSPTVYHQPGKPGVPYWTAAHLSAAMHAGGLLPVYVAPLDGAGYIARSPARDAASAVAQIRALNPDRLLVALDTEQRAYDAAPHRAVTYARDFQRAIHAAGGVTVHYSGRAFLDTLHPYLDAGPRVPWLAWWTTDPTLPASIAAWGPSWAWQYDHDRPIQGTSCDVSRHAHFPLVRPKPPAPAPNPAPAPVPAHTLADTTLAAAFDAWRRTRGV